MASMPKGLKASTPQRLKASPAQSLKASLPQSLKASPPQSLKASPPQSLKASPPQSLKASLPHSLIVFFVALFVRLLHVYQLQSSPFFDVLMGDASGYDQWAQRLAAGDWIGREVFYQAPLYPYFLGLLYAVFGRDLLLVRVIQAAIGSASCVLLALAAARLFNARAGLIAGLALALWAPAIFFDSLLQKSVLDLFWVCLGIYLISTLVHPAEAGHQDVRRRDLSPEPVGSGSSRRKWLALGAAMGCLALTRENALVLVVVLVVWSMVDRSSNLRRTIGERTAPFAIGLLLVLAPVVARNYAVDGGVYVTTSQFGSNFYIGNNPGADGTYASIRFGRGAPEFERLDAKEVAEAATGTALSPADVSRYWTRQAMDFITSQPLRWLTLTGRKVLLLVNRHEMLDTESIESYAEYSLPVRVLGAVTHFGLLVPLAVLGAIAAWRIAPRARILHVLAIAYAASVVMFYVFARYRFPLVPFLLLFASALFVSQSRRALGADRGRRYWRPAAAAIVLAGIVYLPLLSPALMMAITETNLGTALQEQHRYDDAIRHHERAIALVPDYAPAHNNLGAALRATGRLDDAIARYQTALSLHPEYPSASYNLANALLAKGETGASEQQYRAALQASPQSVQAHNNLGIALAGRGDTAGAIAAFRAALAIDDRSVLAHRNLGNALIDSGSRSEGISHLERAVTLAPSDADALYDLGTVLLEDQRFGSAAERFAAALAAKPDWPEAHNNLGIALASQGRIAEAVRHFERAIALKPDFDQARANRDQARAASRNNK